MTTFLRYSITPLLLAASSFAAELPAGSRAFLEKHCAECHAADTAEGDLDLAALKLDLGDPAKQNQFSDRIN